MESVSQPDYRIAILGTGAVGGLLACMLQRQGLQPLCIGRPETVKEIISSGLTLKSNVLGHSHEQPRAETLLNEAVDALIIAVKAPALETSLQRCAPHWLKNGLVLPLLNGIGHMPLLEEHFGKRVIAGTIGAVEVFRENVTTIVHRSPSARIECATDDNALDTPMQALANRLRLCGVDVLTGSQETPLTWHKLSRLCPLAAVTAASGQTLGFCRKEQPWNTLLEAAVAETVAVANTVGSATDIQHVQAAIQALPAQMESSLARDIAQGERGELDAILGNVIALANEQKLQTPALLDLQKRIEERLKEKQQDTE